MPVLLWSLHGPNLGSAGKVLGVPAFVYNKWASLGAVQNVPPDRSPGIPKPVIFIAVGKPFGKIFRRALFASSVPTQFFISGITKDSSGTPIGSCVVKLFRTSDDLLMQSTVSNPVTGAYSFGAVGSANMYVVAYKAGSPDIAGTTVNTLVGS
jgi:hypothetical protein